MGEHQVRKPPFSTRSVIELCWGLTLTLSHEEQQQKLGVNLKDHFVRLFEGPPESFDKVFLENLLMTMTKTLRNMGFVRDSHVRYLDGKAKELQDNGKFLNDLAGITSLSKLGLPAKIVSAIGISSVATLRGFPLNDALSIGIALATIGIPVVFKLIGPILYKRKKKEIDQERGRYWRHEFKRHMTDLLYDLYKDIGTLVAEYYPTYNSQLQQAKNTGMMIDERDDLLGWNETKTKGFINLGVLPPDDVDWP